MAYSEILNGTARKVSNLIYIYSCDFKVRDAISVGARMVIIKSLTNSNFIIYSAVPCTDEVMGQMTELMIENGDLEKGQSLLNHISNIIVPNFSHDSAIAMYKEKNPNIKVIAPNNTPTLKKYLVDYRITKEFGDKIISTDELIKACGLPKDSDLITNKYQFTMLSSHKFNDILMYIPSEKTMLIGDAWMNFPINGKKSSDCDTFFEQFKGIDQLTGWKGFLFKKYAQPGTYFNSLFRYLLVLDNSIISEVFKKIDQNWDFDKVIMLHGEVIERNGKSVWKKVFNQYLV